MNAEIKKKKNEYIIMGMGYPYGIKGTDILIEAYDIIRKKDPKFKFVWIGKYFPEEIRALTKKFEELDDNFIFLGEKKNPFPYLKAADIFVLPSRCDAFPLVVLEAIALGKPIILFKERSGAVEVVRKDCGLIVKDMNASALADAIIKLSKSNKGFTVSALMLFLAKRCGLLYRKT